MIYTFTDFADVENIPEPKHVWDNIDFWVVYTGDDIPKKPVPDIISARQLRLQLVVDGLYTNILNYMATLPDDNAIKIGFEYATEFHRNNAEVIAMFEYFQTDIDLFFINAAQIN